ncbi:MAG: DUF5668 domain-containing protein [Anaerolineales bacterium]
MSRSRVFWALILVLFGFLFLLRNFEIIDIDVWGVFWPTFLILLGVWFIWGSLARTPPVESQESSIALDGGEEARIRVKHGAGRLRVSESTDPDLLLSGVFGWGLDEVVKREGSTMDVLLSPSHGVFPDVIFPWTWTSGHGLDWSVQINQNIPLSLTFETGAGDAQLDLSQMNVKNLKLHTGASSTTLTLPEKAGQTTVQVEAGVASVSIKIPANVAAIIKAEGGLASIQINQERFPRRGDVYQSEDYESAENKVEMKIETGLGSVKVA